MVKKGKLLLALDAQKGRDYTVEKRKRQVKDADKRKRQKIESQKENVDSDEEDDEEIPTLVEQQRQKQAHEFASFSGDDSDGGEEQGVAAPKGQNGVSLRSIMKPSPATTIPADPQSTDNDAVVDEEDEDEEDAEILLSDVDSDASISSDHIPHQRMSINNGPALLQSTKSILVVQPSHTFSVHNSLISPLPPTPTAIPDPDDDLTREAEFYRIARAAALSARDLLAAEGIPFSRPADYFAEMVKTDEHMSRVKKKMYDEAAAKRASGDAKQLRQAKKFGKEVQRKKEEERAREKRKTLNQIQDLKKSAHLLSLHVEPVLLLSCCCYPYHHCPHCPIATPSQPTLLPNHLLTPPPPCRAQVLRPEPRQRTRRPLPVHLCRRPVLLRHQIQIQIKPPRPWVQGEEHDEAHEEGLEIRVRWEEAVRQEQRRGE